MLHGIKCENIRVPEYKTACREVSERRCETVNRVKNALTIGGELRFVTNLLAPISFVNLIVNPIVNGKDREVNGYFPN